MNFKDSFPLEIEFSIDRDRLYRYLRFQALAGCFALVLPLSVFFASAFYDSHMAAYRHAGLSFRIGWLTIYLLGGLIVSTGLTLTAYGCYFRPAARLKVKNLRLLVDGPYLRFVSGCFIKFDRRYHFRDISCYATIEGPVLRRYGMKSLSFRVQGPPHTPPIVIPGVTDAEGVRDVLCEIDASRENHTFQPSAISDRRSQ